MVKIRYYALLWTLVVFSIPIYLSLFPLMNQIDQYLFPVIGEVNYEILSSDDDKVMYRVFVEKKRECSLVSIAAYTETEDGIIKLPPINFKGEMGISSRPVGKHDTGIWEIGVASLLNKPEYIEVVTEHNCLPLWTKITSLGKWKT